MKLQNDRGFQIACKGDVAEVWLYDQIGGDWMGGGITADQFAREMQATKGARNLNVYINSPGGSVFEGNAIHTTLRAHPGKKYVRVDGVAASIASIIAMAGDTIEIAPNALMMIHNPTAMIAGGAREMRETADLLDKVRGQLVDTYVRRTAGDREKISQWMDAETWFTGQEAVAAGFANGLTEQRQVAACLDAPWFRRSPKAEAKPNGITASKYSEWISKKKGELAAIGLTWEPIAK